MVMVVMVMSDLQGDVWCWYGVSLAGVALSVQQRMDVSAHCLTSVSVASVYDSLPSV